MRNKRLLFPIASLGLTLITARACLQFLRPDPPSRQQLPADIFKVHVHVSAEPLSIEVPLIGGRAAKIETPKVAADPQDEFAAIIADFERDPQRARVLADRNDYAVALVYSKRFAEAILVLEEIEHDYPGKYATASNLGTAYELAADVENALIWIRKGVERNAQSHEGTEWLHVAILETKLKMREQPHWLDKHSVLDGQPGMSRAKKEAALEYQLNERLNFIRENDPIMCDLFFQAALLADDPAKQAYFVKQVPRFGTIRDRQLRELGHGS